MVWLLVLGIFYLLGLALALLFFAGVAKANQRWDHPSHSDRSHHDHKGAA